MRHMIFCMNNSGPVTNMVYCEIFHPILEVKENVLCSFSLTLPVGGTVGLFWFVLFRFVLFCFVLFCAPTRSNVPLLRIISVLASL